MLFLFSAELNHQEHSFAELLYPMELESSNKMSELLWFCCGQVQLKFGSFLYLFRAGLREKHKSWFKRKT